MATGMPFSWRGESLQTKRHFTIVNRGAGPRTLYGKLTWLVLGGDPAARSHRVEQLTAL